MADTSDTTRLIEMLIGRQDQQQAQLERLSGLAQAQQETNQRLETAQVQQEARQQETNQRLETAQVQQEARQHDINQRLEATQVQQEARQQETNQRLEENTRQLKASLAKTDEVLLTFGKVQVQIIDRLDAMYTEQVRANGVFTRFMQRQDEFNIIFLEEIRQVKGDVREIKEDIRILKEVTLRQHDDRLRRLEDFMNGLQNAA